MERRGSYDLVEASGSRTPDETFESVSMSERSVGGNDSSSKGTASPSMCSSASTSAENLVGMDVKVGRKISNGVVKYW